MLVVSPIAIIWCDSAHFLFPLTHSSRTSPKFWAFQPVFHRFVSLLIYLFIHLFVYGFFLWDIILSQYFFVQECTFSEYIQAGWLVARMRHRMKDVPDIWYTWCVLLHSLGAFVCPLWSWKAGVHGMSGWWWWLMVAPMVVVVVKGKPDTERENKKGLGLFAFMLILCFPQPHHAQTLRMMWTFPVLSTWYVILYYPSATDCWKLFPNFFFLRQLVLPQVRSTRNNRILTGWKVVEIVRALPVWWKWTSR